MFQIFMNNIPSYLPYLTDDMDTINEFNNIIDNAKPFGMEQQLKIWKMMNNVY